MKTFTDRAALKHRIRRMADRISLAYGNVVRVPYDLHGIDYERLNTWCDMRNVATGTVDTKVWILAAIVRGNYSALARAHPDYKLSKCFDAIDAQLKILEAAARLFAEPNA